MNIENSKRNEPHNFFLNSHFAPRKLSIYYTWKNIRKHYKNNKLKIIAPTVIINLN